MNVIINEPNIANYGKQIIDYSNKFEDEIKKFSMLIDEINTIWEGKDAVKFVNTINEKHKVKFEELKGILDEFGEYLEQVPNTYSTLDDTFSSKYIDV